MFALLELPFTKRYLRYWRLSSFQERQTTLFCLFPLFGKNVRGLVEANSRNIPGESCLHLVIEFLVDRLVANTMGNDISSVPALERADCAVAKRRSKSQTFACATIQVTRLNRSMPARKAETKTKDSAVLQNPSGWSVNRRSHEGE